MGSKEARTGLWSLRISAGRQEGCVLVSQFSMYKYLTRARTSLPCSCLPWQ
jgi:hypothetical protein